MVADVANVEIARGIKLDAVRLLELRGVRGSAVAGIAGLSRAREGGDDAGLRVHFSDGAVHHVGDVKIPAAIKTDLMRQIERCLQRRAAVARVAFLPVARDDMKFPIRGDLAHSLPAVFAKPQCAIRPARDAEGVVNLRGGRRSAVAGGTLHAGAGDGADFCAMK